VHIPREDGWRVIAQLVAVRGYNALDGSFQVETLYQVNQVEAVAGVNQMSNGSLRVNAHE